MTAFWSQYWEWAKEIAPQLNMKEPGGRPAGSTHIFFRPDRFPKHLWLVHKFRQGFVDLEFSGWGDRAAELRKRLGERIPPEGSIVTISKSAALRWPVSEIVPADSREQHVQVREALQAAAALLSWYRRHESEIASIMEHRGEHVG
jgi:hypothetical protein